MDHVTGVHHESSTSRQGGMDSAPIQVSITTFVDNGVTQVKGLDTNNLLVREEKVKMNRWIMLPS